MSTLFISDTHLDAARPHAAADFVALLRRSRRSLDSLYLLGDLVEYWLGDDHPQQGLEAAFGAIAEVARARPVFLMHGNRDFLLSEAVAARLGATLLPDPSVVDLYGTPTLLLHGDTLCTDDVDYQEFRRMVREPAWQAAFLRRPLAERDAVARNARAVSQAAIADKAPQIMDVNAEAVAGAFRRFGVTRIIHGHTHRPAIHRGEVDGVMRERIVLGDWYGTPQYAVCDSNGCRLQRLPAA